MFPEDPQDQLSRTRYSNIPWQPPAAAAPAPGPASVGDDGVDLAQLWGMVRDNAKLVFAIAAVVFIAVMAHCLTSPMLFRSTARMYMGESDPGKSANVSGIDISTGSSEANSEVEVFRSRAMVRKGVLGSGFNVTISPPDWDPPVYWEWLASRRSPALLDGSAAIVTATNTQLAPKIVEPREFKIKFLSPTQYVVRGQESRNTERGELGQPLQLPDASITLLAGEDGPKAGTELDLTIEPLDDAVGRALDKLSISTPKGGPGATDTARVLMLEFVSPSRQLAVSFLEHLMRGYLDTRLEWKTEDASAAEAFVSEQLRTFRESLDQTLSRLADYRTENRVVVLENEAEAAAQQVNRYEEQRVTAQLELSALQQIQRALQNPNLPVEAYMVGEADDTVLQRMAATLAEAREKLSVLRGDFSENAPDVIRQEAQVQAQLTAIRQYVEGRTKRAEKQLAALNGVISRSEAKLKTVPGAQVALEQMGRETEVYSRMYNNLLERKQQAAITKASTVSKNRVLDRPFVPLREDSPKLLLHLASGIIGLLLGAVIVILRGFFSAVFRRENDVKTVLGSLQLVARIPTRARVRMDDARGSSPVFDVLGGRVDPPFTEAFRALRTNLYRALPGEQGKVVMVTSPSAGDGKTTCALAMAAMLAADNRRVLVIDADTRSPTHHELFGIPECPGLRDIIEPGQQHHWREAIRTLCLSSGSFDALCAGDEPSAEFLSDPQFVSFLVHARSQYDFIVLDSPSYPTVSDPLMLAPLCDFVLSVVRLGSTPRRRAEEHLSGIFASARGHGVVVNNIEAAPLSIKSPSLAPRLAGGMRRRS